MNDLDAIAFDYPTIHFGLSIILVVAVMYLIAPIWQKFFDKN